MNFSRLPNNPAQIIRFLQYLGFVRNAKHGMGGHQYKYYHPNRAMICDDNRPFIIVTCVGLSCRLTPHLQNNSDPSHTVGTHSTSQTLHTDNGNSYIAIECAYFRS